MIFIKRALEYLKKKLGKTILLAFIFIVIANFIIAGLLIQKASENAQTNTRLAIGADITFELSIEKVMQDMSKGVLDRSVLKSLTTGGIFISDSVAEGGGPTVENMFKVTDSDYVNTFNFTINSSVTGDIEAYEVDAQQSSNSFTVEGYGVQPTTLASGSIEMVEGTLPTEGKAEVIISSEVADLNNLRVGDSLALTYSGVVSEDVKLDHTIVGIYETSEAVQNVNNSAGFPQNKIYTYYSIYETVGLSNEDLSKSVVSNTKIILNDPEDIEAYKSEIDSKMNLSYGSLNANDDLYNSLVGPIESIGLITQIFVASIIVTGGFIVGLITALTINDRKNEIGILLAVGESKFKIVGHFVLEVVLIAVLAFGLSMFTGEVLGENMSETLLNSEVFGETQEVPTFGQGAFRAGAGQKNGGPGGNIFSLNGGSNQVDVEKAQAAAELNIGLDISTIAQIFGIGLLLTVVSTSIPTIYVMRFSPKQILTNRDS